MKPSDPIAISTKYKLLLVLLALVGVILILFSTNRWGAGLSPDSVGYVGTARHLIEGAGFIDYDGSVTVKWPPLYPALLALVGGIFGTDPLSLAHILNALIFGLIVYLGGMLILKHLSTFPAFALVGMLAIVFPRPLVQVSVMAWSEPLFICFVLLSLIFAQSYLTKNDVTSLLLFSSAVALASLTRYIGVSLILWGALIILIFQRDSLKNRIAHLSFFMLISALPLGLWLIRNYATSSTLLGPRASSAFTLAQNLTIVFDSILYWYIPGRISEQSSTLMLGSATAGFLAGLSSRDSWQRAKVGLRKISPIILFALVYTAFLVISSTTTNYDQIDNRLLSPIYVPLTLFWLISAQAAIDPYQKRFPKKIVSSFLVIGIAIWLVFLILSNMLYEANLFPDGKGYNSEAWVDSETVQYLLQNPTLESECTFYTNGPDAAYILTDLTTKWSLARTRNNSSETVNDISRLSGTWPKESNACLIWFDKLGRKSLFTIDELQAIATIDLIARLGDGAIYSITRK